jgi:membrane associated rhomboid family serine protease
VFPLRDNIPTRRFPLLTVAFIAINVAVWLVLQKAGTAGDRQYLDYGAIPCDITGADPSAEACPSQDTAWPLTLLTSMFMHGGWLHLGGNMLFLWIFGNNIEDSMGRPRFVAFYVLGGIAALAAQVIADPSSTAPTVGASGAIAGVLGGYLVLYPRAKVVSLVFVVLFFTVLEVPAFLFLLIWIAQQALFVSMELSDPTGASGGVAYFAHIGGFIFGALFIRSFATHVNRPAVA